jgi:predicted GH43/DUF377 family glycosyl hydrolase
MDVVNAAVWHGEGRDWDNIFTDPGAVVYHDGLFHMFRNGFQSWPAAVQIGYLTSEDGINWTEMSEDPVFTHEEVPFDVTASLASSALVEDDGTWVLYFYNWPSSTVGTDAGIARATATDPMGPWVMDETLVLTPSSDPAAWDSSQLSSPSVVKADDEYVMYYASFDQSFQYAIGRATSEDGLTWVKDEEPVFEISGVDGTFDSFQVQQPRVVLGEDGYVMLYRSYFGNDTQRAYGLAVSEDGIAWERLSDEPLIDEDGALYDNFPAQTRGMWFSELAYHDGTYYVYLELQRGLRFQTDIYAGSFEGPLR